MRLRYDVRALENLDFSFPLGKLTVNPIQVKRVDVEPISQHIREIHERNTMGCARIEGYCFFPVLFIINYRCAYEGFACL